MLCPRTGFETYNEIKLLLNVRWNFLLTENIEQLASVGLRSSLAKSSQLLMRSSLWAEWARLSELAFNVKVVRSPSNGRRLSALNDAEYILRTL